MKKIRNCVFVIVTLLSPTCYSEVYVVRHPEIDDACAFIELDEQGQWYLKIVVPGRNKLERFQISNVTYIPPATFSFDTFEGMHFNLEQINDVLPEQSGPQLMR